MRHPLRTPLAAVAIVLGLGPITPLRAVPPCAAFADRRWCNQGLSPDDRAAALLPELTQDEKFQLMGGDDPTGVLQLGPGEQHVGTSLGITRLGIPTVFFTDGPVGVRQGNATAMPAPVGLAATFDPSLARRYGAVIANEARAKRNDVLHAPPPTSCARRSPDGRSRGSARIPSCPPASPSTGSSAPRARASSRT